MKRGLIRLAESGLIPDEVIRRGISLLNRKRLRLEEAGSAEERQEKKNRFIDDLQRSPIVLQPEKPREQHYELPPAFFRQVLGRHLKYSCGLWADSVQNLDEAEEAMLEETCRRAGIVDGQTILDAGCGWGALSLYIAEHFPRCRVVAVSNSLPQRQFIEGLCRERGIASVEVRTADIDAFNPGSDASTVSSPSRCSNTCGTTGKCSGVYPPGLSRGGRFLSISSATGSTPTCTNPKKKMTGWANISSPRG